MSLGNGFISTIELEYRAIPIKNEKLMTPKINHNILETVIPWRNFNGNITVAYRSAAITTVMKDDADFANRAVRPKNHSRDKVNPDRLQFSTYGTSN